MTGSDGQITDTYFFCILHIYVLSSIIWQSLIAQSLTIVEISRGQNQKKHLNDISKISQQKKYLCIHISKKVKLKTTENQCMVLKVSWVFWVTKGINLPFLLQYPVNDQAKGHQPQLLLNLLSYGHLLTLLLCPAQLLQ